MNEENYLWRQFNLGKRNHSPGGGILYCLKYSLPRIEAHQEAVVDALIDLGINIVESEGFLVLRCCDSSDEIKPNRLFRVNALVEELSCLNEAAEYSIGGFGECRTIEDLKNRLMFSYFSFLEKGNQASAYEFVEFAIPEIVRDLRVAHRQNKVLSSKDRMVLEELATFAKRQADHMNDPRGYVVFGQ